MHKTTVANVHINTAEKAEFADIVDTQVSEELLASAEDLTTVWRHFRVLDGQSLAIYGYPVENDGREIKIPPELTDAQKIQALVVHTWFRSFVIQKNITILRIETPLGGIFIRKTLPGECVHKFVTMDLPGDPNASLSVASFEAT